jgi:hypothetical protein
MEGDDELLAETEVKVAPSRDEWMTTLPPERKVRPPSHVIFHQLQVSCFCSGTMILLFNTTLPQCVNYLSTQDDKNTRCCITFWLCKLVRLETWLSPFSWLTFWRLWLNTGSISQAIISLVFPLLFYIMLFCLPVVITYSLWKYKIGQVVCCSCNYHEQRFWNHELEFIVKI